MRSERLDGGIRTATSIDRDVRLLVATDVAVSPVDVVILAVVIEGPVRRPGLTEDVGVLVGASVAPGVVDVVAILCLVVVAAAGDQVNGQSSFAELVKGGHLAGSHGGRHEPGPMSQKELQTAGHRSGMGTNEEAVWSISEIADQDAIEVGLFVDPCRLGHDVGVKRGANGLNDL